MGRTVQQSYHLFCFAFSQLRLLTGKKGGLFHKTMFFGLLLKQEGIQSFVKTRLRNLKKYASW